jgi:hypothetical protein
VDGSKRAVLGEQLPEAQVRDPRQPPDHPVLIDLHALRAGGEGNAA